MFTPKSVAVSEEKNVELIQFISIDKLSPAQTRYSMQNAKDKADKAAKKENMWKHHGTSILSTKKALPVVQSIFGYVLVDGHHDVVASLMLKAKQVPVKIIANLSHLSIDQFWIEAEKNGWAYLYNIDGKKMLPPKCFTELLDDPNRYFAALTARKYTSNDEGGFVSKGAEYPLWLKIDKDIPFIEFQIANALYKENFIYDPEKMKDSPEVIEHARQILVKANIPGLRILSNRVHHQDISIDEILHSNRDKVPGISMR